MYRRVVRKPSPARIIPARTDQADQSFRLRTPQRMPPGLRIGVRSEGLKKGMLRKGRVTQIERHFCYEPVQGPLAYFGSIFRIIMIL